MMWSLRVFYMSIAASIVRDVWPHTHTTHAHMHKYTHNACERDKREIGYGYERNWKPLSMYSMFAFYVDLHGRYNKYLSNFVVFHSAMHSVYICQMQNTKMSSNIYSLHKHFPVQILLAVDSFDHFFFLKYIMSITSNDSSSKKLCLCIANQNNWDNYSDLNFY